MKKIKPNETPLAQIKENKMSNIGKIFLIICFMSTIGFVITGPAYKWIMYEYLGYLEVYKYFYEYATIFLIVAFGSGLGAILFRK